MCESDSFGYSHCPPANTQKLGISLPHFHDEIPKHLVIFNKVQDRSVALHSFNQEVVIKYLPHSLCHFRC